MTKVSMSTKLKASADQVWGMIGQFNALPDWHPSVEKSRLEKAGQMRRLSLAGGGTVIEKLESVNEKERTYTYSIVDSPLPLANYTATLKVTDEGDGCVVEWTSEFDPMGGLEGQSADAIRGIYQSGFDSLRKMFGGI